MAWKPNFHFHDSFVNVQPVTGFLQECIGYVDTTI